MISQNRSVPLAFRELAYNNTASISVQLTPTVALCANESNTDPAFNISNGVITFNQDVAWVSSISVLATCSADSPIYYTDAEVSVDGGVTWVRGSNSLRMEQLAVGYTRTREFSFAGRFAAGYKLRFVEWASGAGVTLQTIANSGSTAPARRITYMYMPAMIA